jgi:hypothetical protein
MAGLTQRIVTDLLVARKASQEQEQDNANFLFAVVEPAVVKAEPAVVKAEPAVVKAEPAVGVLGRWEKKAIALRAVTQAREAAEAAEAKARAVAKDAEVAIAAAKATAAEAKAIAAEAKATAEAAAVAATNSRVTHFTSTMHKPMFVDSGRYHVPANTPCMRPPKATLLTTVCKVGCLYVVCLFL